jgi:hypothetical protein
MIAAGLRQNSLSPTFRKFIVRWCQVTLALNEVRDAGSLFLCCVWLLCFFFFFVVLEMEPRALVCARQVICH